MLTPRRRLWLGALVVLAALGLLGVVSLRDTSGRVSQPPSALGAVTPADPVSTARVDAQRRIVGDPLALGPVDAPVVMSEWGDFQCPFCREFAADTEPALIREYIQSGRVRLEWHDLAYLGPESVLAAQGARAAGRQGAFWEFHDALYRTQSSEENSGAINEASLVAMARDLGLDADRFARDVADPTIAAQVGQDQRDGARLGITRVPTFLINGTLLFGAQPVATFRQALDAALSAGH